jgi:predicted regulator of Ras-like GTPase activity (Roadblock/LC7/MglB family)
MTRQEEIQALIDKLRSLVPDIIGVLVGSSDGLAIAQSLSNIDGNRVAAMAATALGLGRRIVESLNAGTFSETSVTGSEGQIFVYNAGTKGVLAVMVGKNANIGLVHLEARDIAKAIAGVLG